MKKKMFFMMVVFVVNMELSEGRRNKLFLNKKNVNAFGGSESSVQENSRCFVVKHQASERGSAEGQTLWAQVI